MDKRSDTLAFETLRIFWRAAARHKWLLLLTLLNPLGAVFMSVVVPYFAGKVFAELAHQGPELNHHLVMLGAASAIGVLGNRFGFTRLFLMQARVMSDLHEMVLTRLLRRSIGYHTNNISGKLISDALDFVNSFGIFMGSAIITGLSFVSIITVGVIIVFCNSWQLGLFLVGVVTITLVWAIIESRRRSNLRHKRLIATKKLTGHLSDVIVNAQTVKTFAGEAIEIEESNKLNTILRKLRERDWQRAGRSGNNRMAALLLMQFCMIILLTHLVRSHPQMLATGIFAFTYTFTLTNRLFDINQLTRQLEDAFLQAAPMTQMLLESVEITDKPNATKLKLNGGTIELRDISFAYKEKSNHQQVFKHFSLKIAPGEKIGLVGPSGGGKSTLTRLLLRFDEVQDGEILIDDQNINDVTQTSLRTAVSYVPQEPLLFHRSIRENIAYGKPGASEEEIMKAAKKANAHSFIKHLPSGYDTIVGERGVKLSGGQRQRVAIARAILKDAPILVLDEATSALDSENEVEVQKALWELMKGRTVIVIAHRLSTIQKMDRIIVLENGKVTEEGPHKQLLKHKDGTYAKLWAHQSGGFIEE